MHGVVEQIAVAVVAVVVAVVDVVDVVDVALLLQVADTQLASLLQQLEQQDHGVLHLTTIELGHQSR